MPLTLAGATALAGGLSAGGSTLGGLLGYLSNERTNKANMKLAEYQFEKNLEMWNKQNEYNTPAAQMERLKAAGLNPNLVYSNGADNTASSAPSYEAPRLQAYTNFGDLGMSQVTQSMLTAKQIENMEEQNAILRIDARAKQQAILHESLKMAFQAFQNKAQREDYQTERNLKSLAEKNAWQTYHIGVANERKLKADTDLAYARSALAGVQKQLSEAQIKEINRILPLKIAQMETLTEGYSQSNRITTRDADMYTKYNIRPSDPLWVRALVLAIDQVIPQDSKAHRIIQDFMNGDFTNMPGTRSGSYPDSDLGNYSTGSIR